MVNKSKYIINILLIILGLLFFGCTEDIPDKIDKSQVPAPPALKVVSTTVQNQDEISPDQIISVSFNNYMETVNIYISGVNGSLEFDSTGTSATFKPSSKLKDGAYTLTMSGKDKFGQEIAPTTITFYVKSGIIASSSMIAFASVLDGDYEIYLMKTDGSGIKQLTYNSDQDTQPAWSPNGQYITFSSDGDGSWEWNSDIFIMRSDGTGITNLTKTLVVNDYSSFWSYDSKKIGFISDDGGFEDYYVMNVDGTGIRLMDDYEYLDFIWPGLYGKYIIYFG